MKKIEFTNNNNSNVTNALIENIEGLTSLYAQKLLKNKDVLVNGKRINTNINLFGQENIACFVDESKLKKFYEIIFEDENVCILFKNSGIEVCDGEHNIEKFLNKHGTYFAIHRLDRNTEGLVIFAKNLKAKTELDKSIKDKSKITKLYTAEVYGIPKKQEMQLEGYLKKDASKSLVKIFNSPQKDAVKIQTNFKVLSTNQITSLLEVSLITGKTHQIRAHLAHIGLPIIGDGKYGDYKANQKFNARIQHLTATKLIFNLVGPLSYLNNLRFETTPSWMK